MAATIGGAVKNSGASVGPWSVNIPSGIQDGDYWFILLTKDDDPAVTAPSGFSTAYQENSTTNADITIAGFYRYYATAPVSAVSITGGDNESWIAMSYYVRDADTSTFISGASGTPNTDNASNSPTCSAPQSGGASGDLTICHDGSRSNVVPGGAVAPTGMTIVTADQEGTGNGDAQILVGQEAYVDDSSHQWTGLSSQRDWVGVTFVIKSAATGPVVDKLDLAQGIYRHTGSDAVLKATFPFTASDDDYQHTGGDITTQLDRILALEVDSFLHTGGDLVLRHEVKLTLEDDDYKHTGRDIVTQLDRHLTLESTSFQHTGDDLTFQINRILTLVGDNYPHTGGAVTFVDPDGVVEVKLDLNQGSYQHTGGDVATQLNRLLIAAAEDYQHTGGDLGFGILRKLGLEQGSYQHTGRSAILKVVTAGGPSEINKPVNLWSTFIRSFFSRGTTDTNRHHLVREGEEIVNPAQTRKYL